MENINRFISLKNVLIGALAILIISSVVDHPSASAGLNPDENCAFFLKFGFEIKDKDDHEIIEGFSSNSIDERFISFANISKLKDEHSKYVAYQVLQNDFTIPTRFILQAVNYESLYEYLVLEYERASLYLWNELKNQYTNLKSPIKINLPSFYVHALKKLGNFLKFGELEINDYESMIDWIKVDAPSLAEKLSAEQNASELILNLVDVVNIVEEYLINFKLFGIDMDWSMLQTMALEKKKKEADEKQAKLEGRKIHKSLKKSKEEDSKNFLELYKFSRERIPRSLATSKGFVQSIQAGLKAKIEMINSRAEGPVLENALLKLDGFEKMATLNAQFMEDYFTCTKKHMSTDGTCPGVNFGETFLGLAKAAHDQKSALVRRREYLAIKKTELDFTNHILSTGEVLSNLAYINPEFFMRITDLRAIFNDRYFGLKDETQKKIMKYLGQDEVKIYPTEAYTIIQLLGRFFWRAEEDQNLEYIPTEFLEQVDKKLQRVLPHEVH